MSECSRIHLLFRKVVLLDGTQNIGSMFLHPKEKVEADAQLEFERHLVDVQYELEVKASKLSSKQVRN